MAREFSRVSRPRSGGGSDRYDGLVRRRARTATRDAARHSIRRPWHAVGSVHWNGIEPMQRLISAVAHPFMTRDKKAWCSQRGVAHMKISETLLAQPGT